MSGGAFDYNQYRIRDVIDSLKEVLDNKRNYNKKWNFIENDYTDETFEEFKTALEILGNAEIYVQRIDWLLSGDDGEETFHKRLAEDFEEIKQKRIENER